ncbi:RING finger protein 151 isoform X2 [Brienomyrus brachyistius]|uniref:RING finger protein 151 isoform X2 n=1 Tax=Brienomyrus brachyistius TaxID=42636 RepID=UPI0020B3C168|nr:RING finger protein 151 isoform X2 [Brienomyrus brachyistius]
MSGGYDVEYFVDSPGQDLICSICRGVLRCPVRVGCHHVFCKKCILQWLRRKESCPCCRKPIRCNLIFVMYKLSKSIGRLKVKCRNAACGCPATFPLAQLYSHSTRCLFEVVPCPQQGCGAQVQRGELQAHAELCEHRCRPCPMGCGSVLSQQDRAQHNCYRQLQQELEARQEAQRVAVTGLQRQIRKIESSMTRMRRQVGLLCKSLGVKDHQEGAAEGDTESSSF